MSTSANFNLLGKIALITGASRGIGYLTAVYMAQHGCNLVLHSRSLEHSKKVLEEVRALGVEAYAVQADLGNHPEVLSMLDEIISHRSRPMHLPVASPPRRTGVQSAA